MYVKTSTLEMEHWADVNNTNNNYAGSSFFYLVYTKRTKNMYKKSASTPS